MNYISNRNHCCRLTEFNLKGCRALTLENDVLRLLILLGKGADIAEFTYKRTDTDFMWRSPAGLDALDQRGSGGLCYVGGWFECFPNAGGHCTHKGMPIAQYGDVKDLPWEYTVLQDQAEKIVLKLFVRSNLLPLYLERVLTLERGSVQLRIEETAENLSNREVEFTWGHHPNIGQPFLNESCVIELSGGEMAVFETVEGRAMEKPVGHWPYLEEGNGRRDLRPIPSPEENLHDLLYIRDMPGNTATVRDTKTGLGFRLEWDAAAFKAMLLWRAFDAMEWGQIFGHRYILCFLLKSSHASAVADASLQGTALRLPPFGRLSTWIKASVITQ